MRLGSVGAVNGAAQRSAVVGTVVGQRRAGLILHRPLVVQGRAGLVVDRAEVTERVKNSQRAASVQTGLVAGRIAVVPDAADGDGSEADPYVVVENSAYLASSLNTRNGDNTGAAYNFNYLYAQFLDEYLPEYDSEWNYGVTFQITSNGKVGTYTKMCVPNMMMFNGEGEGAAEMVGLAEAEYTYANTSVEGTAENVEWTNAIMAIFDENPYAYYAPLPDEVEATEEESSGESSAPSAPAADAGGGC